MTYPVFCSLLLHALLPVTTRLCSLLLHAFAPCYYTPIAPCYYTPQERRTLACRRSRRGVIFHGSSLPRSVGRSNAVSLPSRLSQVARLRTSLPFPSLSPDALHRLVQGRRRMDIARTSRKGDLFEIGAEFALCWGCPAKLPCPPCVTTVSIFVMPALAPALQNGQSPVEKGLDSAWSDGKNVWHRVNTQIPVSLSSEFKDWPEAMSCQTSPLQVNLLFRRLSLSARLMFISSLFCNFFGR